MMKMDDDAERINRLRVKICDNATRSKYDILGLMSWFIWDQSRYHPNYTSLDHFISACNYNAKWINDWTLYNIRQEPQTSPCNKPPK